MEMDTTCGGLALRTPLSFPSNYDEFASPYHEIGIIKLTAMFVARYGGAHLSGTDEESGYESSFEVYGTK